MIKSRKINTLLLFLFSIISYPVCAQHSSDNAEVKKIEKTISKVIKIPTDFKEKKESACFSLKFIFSNDAKLKKIIPSLRAPAKVDSSLFNIDNYLNINWTRLFKSHIHEGDDLIIVVSIHPDDSVEGMPNITHNQVDDLFNFGKTGNIGSTRILPKTLVLQYGQAMK